jgi:two-component SAPR family response regulator
MKHLRIVIAEDETVTAMTVKGMLESLGHEVIGEAVNGTEAVQLVRELQPDLVFMDIEMPEMDGIEAASTISRECPTPIIFLTAYSGERLAEQASRAGGLAYLVKPIKSRDLAPAIVMATASFQRLQLSRTAEVSGEPGASGGASEKTMTSQPLRAFCLGQFAIYREAELIAEEEWAIHKAGGRKAKAVLAYLLGHRQTGASREDMIDFFWPEADYDSASNSFNRTMHALRRALEPDLKAQGKSAYISRQHGLYRLNADLVWLDDDVFYDHIRKGNWLKSNGHVESARQELEQAAKTYGGDWMKGAPYADDWCLAGREERKAEYVRIRYTLAEFARKRGALSDEVQHYQRILEQDPYHEQTHQKLILAYSQGGRRNDALKHVHLYEQRCQELGVEPSPAVVGILR